MNSYETICNFSQHTYIDPRNLGRRFRQPLDGGFELRQCSPDCAKTVVRPTQFRDEPIHSPMRRIQKITELTFQPLFSFVLRNLEVGEGSGIDLLVPSGNRSQGEFTSR